MRKVPVILSAMLIVSLVTNGVLWYRAETARNDAVFNAGVAEVVGMYWGESEAERDYESGVLHWYQFDNSGDIPKDKSDRQIMTVDLALEPTYLHRPYFRFVESYNRTIDNLEAEKNAPPRRKKWKR